MASDQTNLQWRWYRAPGAADSIAQREFEALPTHGRAALLEAIRRFRAGKSTHGEVKKLEDTKGLWEIRVQVGSDPFRAVFFKDSPVHRVCVLAIYKNQQKLPKSDRDTATARAEAWRARGRADRAQ